VDHSGERRISFAELLLLFRSGDPDAAQELVRRYTPLLRHVVRNRLPQRMRGEFESLDFAQEVWLAVCDRPDAPARIADEVGLKQYLVQIAVSRVVDAFRRRTALRNYGGVPDQRLEIEGGLDPTPSQFAMAGERWDSIAASLPRLYVAVVDRVRQGYSHKEVAEQTGVSLRTISRILQRVQRHCEGVPA